MGKDSSIQWTDHTWNPWRGCTKVSPGCTNCYAETLSHRNPAIFGKWGPNGTRVVASESKWREPLAWDRAAKKAGERHRVFCASLADVFEDWSGPMVTSQGLPYWWCYGSLSNSPLPSTGIEQGCRLATMDDIRERLFQLIEDTPNLDWLLLTKRPENALKMMVKARFYTAENPSLPCPQKNLWLGTTCENQKQADLRVPHLLKTPAAVRFLSVEPMLERIDLGLLGTLPKNEFPGYQMTYDRLHWIIVGGESGHHTRPFDLAWARDLRDQCAASGVPFFMKQLGSNPIEWEMCGIAPGSISAAAIDSHLAMGGSEPDDVCHPLKLKDGHGGDMDEWPDDLRVRNFPEPKGVPLGQV